MKLNFKGVLILGNILDFLGSIFGYILWFFFDAVSNYAIAILIFTVFINMLMFPIAIKRQKTMASNARMAEKQKELKKKYEKDIKKYNEEMARLYEKEGINPMSGCLSTMILPLILWSGMIGAINRPLQNTLHIPTEKIAQAVEVLPTLSEIEGKFTKGYEELQIVRYFPEIKDHLTMFNEEELADIEEYSSGFDFLGINLLKKPKDCAFSEMLWLIPILCFISSVFMMYVSQKTSGIQSQMQGCAKFLPYCTFIITSYWAYAIPGAVGIYWILNSVIGLLQNLVLNRFYNTYTLNAKDEAMHYAALKIKESYMSSNRDNMP